MHIAAVQNTQSSFFFLSSLAVAQSKQRHLQRQGRVHSTHKNLRFLCCFCPSLLTSPRRGSPPDHQHISQEEPSPSQSGAEGAGGVLEPGQVVDQGQFGGRGVGVVEPREVLESHALQ